MSEYKLRKTLDKAVQLAEIASDWNLDEVEIDGEMVDIYELRDEFKAQAAEVVPSGIAQTIRGLLEAGVAGTESTIRTRDYHGLRAFVTTEEEWLERYNAALAWLDALTK